MQENQHTQAPGIRKWLFMVLTPDVAGGKARWAEGTISRRRETSAHADLKGCGRNRGLTPGDGFRAIDAYDFPPSLYMGAGRQRQVGTLVAYV